MRATDFNIGDIVRRTKEEHAGMNTGDTDEIISIDEKENRVGLKTYVGYTGKFRHDPNKLELVHSNTEIYTIF